MTRINDFLRTACDAQLQEDTAWAMAPEKPLGDPADCNTSKTSNWLPAAWSVLSQSLFTFTYAMQHRQGCSMKQEGCMLPGADCKTACSVPRLLLADSFVLHAMAMSRAHSLQGPWCNSRICLAHIWRSISAARGMVQVHPLIEMHPSETRHPAALRTAALSRWCWAGCTQDRPRRESSCRLSRRMGWWLLKAALSQWCWARCMKRQSKCAGSCSGP